MSKEKDEPTFGDLLFRRGQAWIGSQQGKQNELTHDALNEERQQTKLLKEMTALQRETTALAVYQPPAEITLSPQGDDMGSETQIENLLENLSSEFEALVDAQQNLAAEVANLGLIGQNTLQEAKIHTDILNSLDEHSREAFHQRNEALQTMGQALIEHRKTNNNLETINDNVIDIRKSIDLSTAALSADFESLENAVCAALGDIGVNIRGLTAETVKSRLAVVQTLQDSQALFLWSHRENMWVRQRQLQTQRHIEETLRNPRKSAAYEAWEIGEKCRLAGDTKSALEMFRSSMKTNPAETRNYVSMGFICLNRGDSKQAKEFLAQGIKYAENPHLKGTALMYLAKVEMFDGNLSQAKTVLETALETDVTNLEIWFDLAVCEMKQGNGTKALFYIRNLLYAPLHVPQAQAKEAVQYALKIMAETTFNPLMPKIRLIMQEIINNQT